jgi:hypothetical protein
VWLVYNWWRFGNPLDSGYLRDSIPGFGSPIVSGLAGLMFSPASSLIVYCPLALAGFAGLVFVLRRDLATGVLLGGLVAAFVLFYAQLGNWMGGRSYGPRYLVAVLPLLCVGLAPVLAAGRFHRSILALAVVSAAVQLPGVAVDYAKVSVEHATASGTSGGQMRMHWGNSALALNTRATVRAVPHNIDWVLGTRPRPPLLRAEGLARGQFSQQFAYSLDFWWLYLFHMRGIGADGVMLVVAGFLAALAWLCWGLCRLVPAAR